MSVDINQLRDKSRALLHRFSHWLGETASVQPQSLYDKAQAEESLRLDLPAVRNLLPYDSFDNCHNLFINRHSMGFGLHLQPSAGADESLVKSLAEIFKNKLPEGFDCTILLYRHHYLAEILNTSYAPILQQNNAYAELAQLNLNYHLQATQDGYANGRNIPALLADYCCYLFISAPKSQIAHDQLVLLRADLSSELKVAGLISSPLDQEDFTIVLRTIVSPNLQATTWPVITNTRSNNDNSVIGNTIPDASAVYTITPNNIDISLLDKEQNLQATRLVNLEITSFPTEQFALWQTPDLFANLLKPEQGILCPFIISFTIRGVNQEKIKAYAKQRAKSLAANHNAIQRFINPGLSDEAAEWQFVHNNAAQGNIALMPTFYNLILFTTADKEREHVAKAISSYRYAGFNLIVSRCKQWLRFLGSLPFMLSEGLFSSLQMLGMTKQLSHDNIANLLPIIADLKGSAQGLLLPTYRHQLFYLDGFDDRTLPITNFNRLTVASPGAGKTLFEQALILDGLSRGQVIFVIDLGASYKHLCHLVGGTYIDAATLSLNPFTLFDFEGTTNIAGDQVNDYIQIRDLLAIMASPAEALAEVQKTWLLEAVLSCWREYGRQATMDNVLQALQDLLLQPASQNDQRLKDLFILLAKYGSQGIYGHMFNSATPLLNGKNFVVLEMGALESNPELLTIVMFVMIVIIQGQFYHSDRRLKKRCVIDEAWRFLASGSNNIAAKFIEQGFRTARKHNGGFTVITQHLSDTSKTVQGQAIAASSDIKVIMRQGGFKDYVESHPEHFNPLQIAMIEAFGEAKTQGFSNVMLQFGNMVSFHRYFCDPFLRVLFSTSGDEFGEIEALLAAGVSLGDAVNQVAQKYYGEPACA